MRDNRTRSFFTARISKLPQLTDREKYILIERLCTTTLEKIGSEYNLTEARIRQIEKIALEKVKAKSYQQLLLKLPKNRKRNL
jgi:DNA-directed RNA polymerase sigma subunit (sigma70/sigma32)